jgi:type III secretory pathway component EscV
MNPGIMGGIVGSAIGVAGGLVGTYFSIKNTKTSREHAFMVKASVVAWVFIAVFVLGMCLIPGFYKVYLAPIYVVALVVGILFGNKRQAQIRLEESRGDA